MKLEKKEVVEKGVVMETYYEVALLVDKGGELTVIDNLKENVGDCINHDTVSFRFVKLRIR